MATFRDLLAAAKSEITEVDTAGAAERIAAGALVLDVREPDEYDAGRAARRRPHPARPPRGAGRGSRSSTRPRRSSCTAPAACARRSPPSTLQELGYTDVVVDGRRLRPLEGRGPRRGSSRSSLTAEQTNRYKRHLLLPEVGVEGQAKLLDSKVLLLGAGGLGSPAALYLAAAGVGTIGIVDMDEVDASNLQRQILHNVDRIGDRKVDSAKKTLTMLNPDVDVVTYDTRLDADNIIDIISGYDVIVDGADNFP